jgi:hypothetical protein
MARASAFTFKYRKTTIIGRILTAKAPSDLWSAAKKVLV